MITIQDLPVIGLLVFLEGILSIDNALVLAILARHLPPHLQKKALTYGLVGALVFRAIALGLTQYLLALNWVKYVGGGYLLFLSGKYFVEYFKKKDESGEGHKKPKPHSFWKTVFLIELTDIAFALDSILAAVALTPKFWVVFIGGVLGMVAMRFSSSIFIKLLNRFPGFETAAYVLVSLIGVKVILEAMHIEGLDFHSISSPATIIFWGLMLSAMASGFVIKKKEH